MTNSLQQLVDLSDECNCMVYATHNKH